MKRENLEIQALRSFTIKDILKTLLLGILLIEIYGLTILLGMPKG